MLWSKTNGFPQPQEFFQNLIKFLPQSFSQLETQVLNLPDLQFLQ
jgi:hypothetical protein